MSKRSFLNDVVALMSGIKKTEKRTATLDEVLEGMAQAPEMATTTKQGKTKRVGNKPATPRQIFSAIIRQVETATAPDAANPDSEWQATCAKIREKLHLVGGQGRSADMTPAPDGNLDELL